ncbi:pyridoxal 5'-phosphate synthase-like subunit PDX1.2 [Hevea brasiliensis]|uniref:pyridoxal 5'-phosphate synthase-like subunit PDX1.2 n=1 Tax=Hevea brasiliensis TaxID=3981 RepID=UPI0025F7E371|nr:pyridoxal 5'-phosphate synthase-like subunit PDX1.2 [Hevea brasiliensis]
MANTDMDIPVGDLFADSDGEEKLFSFKVGLAQLMLRSGGGVVVEVTNTEEATIAEEAGAACCVVSGRLMLDLPIVRKIKRAVSIPVMVRIRAGHFVEAWILEAIGVDFVDESELLGNAFSRNYINKHYFRAPFACGCKNLEEALARIVEGAAIIWIQGEESSLEGTAENVRSIMQTTTDLARANEDEVSAFAEEMEVSYDLVAQIKEMGKLPVVQIAMGGIESPADAALMMQLGCDGVCVRSKFFQYPDSYLWNPFRRLRAIVEAVKHYNNPLVLAECINWMMKNEDDEDDDNEDLT